MDYYHERLKEILPMVRNRKLKPDPVDVLPKLPLHEESQYVYEPYRKDGIFRAEGGYHEVWKNGEFIESTDTKGAAWNIYWSERAK